ncbi:hypothetical protein [Acinetobacter zhairhuonensis]|uniref:hypothetical protein n=1 Tax=Acinetobacter sp. A7.4 TaxID=2919921 RepID=UPI001F4F1A5B|nr:hypothetical protein [Acinetobacter sp. A7.4]MCJ8162313.1 hypothetical protein [Acinetobacter sp. A7.4]
MNIKEFFIAFGASTFIGYLYMSGRLIIEGYTTPTGYDYLDLNFDFGDYVYTGVFYNIILLIKPFSIVLSALLLILLFFRSEISVRIRKSKSRGQYYLIIFWKKYIRKETNIIHSQIYRQIRSRIQRDSIRYRNQLFPNFLLISYFILIFFTLTIYTVLILIINFSEKGKEASKTDVLKKTNFVQVDNRQLFKVICGKSQCIYANKSYDFFKKIKEDNYEVRKLPKIHTQSSESDIAIYQLSANMVNNLERIIYIQIHPGKKTPLNSLEYRLHIKQSLPYKPNFHFEKECYKGFQDDFTISVNQIKVKDKDDLPYFVAFKIPENKQVNYIEVFNPGKQMMNFNHCK